MNNKWIVENIKDYVEWSYYVNKCSKKSLTQSWSYGEAKQEAEKWVVKRYLVLNKRKIPISIFQVLIKKIPLIGGIARINKGPLLIKNESNNTSKLCISSIQALTKELKKERIFMTQIAPLIEPSKEVQIGLHNLGYRKTNHPPQDSGLISLIEDEDLIMSRFHKTWRYDLRKGLKIVDVKIDSNGYKFFDLLIEFYNKQQNDKKFVGTSNQMLAALMANQSDKFKCNILVAYAKNSDKALGVILSIQHDDFSEYVVGVSNEEGRKNNANSVLLWNVMLEAKKNGALWFDVGGLNDKTLDGIARFKKRMNPIKYSLTGEWRKWF